MNRLDIDYEMLEMAWVIIANAKDWDDPSRQDWIRAAEKWRDFYHKHIGVGNANISSTE